MAPISRKCVADGKMFAKYLCKNQNTNKIITQKLALARLSTVCQRGNLPSKGACISKCVCSTDHVKEEDVWDGMNSTDFGGTAN